MTIGFVITNNGKGYAKSRVLSKNLWTKLEIGARVRSKITGTLGNISSLDENWKEVHIDWDNGKKSRAKHLDLENVEFFNQKDGEHDSKKR